ncbi:MAG TPA: hypothetical protein ENN21_06030 [Spirochaetes bacterium]|nr:hypothetical protein [Spirochaetota bacterium]
MVDIRKNINERERDMIIEDGIYTIAADGKKFEADIKKREDGLYWLTVVDPNEKSGMGAGARDFELEWIESRLNGREGLTRIWGTVWEIRGEGLVREVLSELGAQR